MTKSEIISWYRIQEMFRFHSFHMYGVIGSAVILGMIQVFVIKKINFKNIGGKIIEFGFLLGDALIMEIDWNFLIFFTSISICGTFLGTYFTDKINSNQLKKGFGYFIFLMAIIMLVFELK